MRDLVTNGISLRERTKVFESLIVSRIRYAISVYGSGRAVLITISKFLQSCQRREYTSKHYNAKLIRDEEDEKLHNPRHPLFRVFQENRKQRTQTRSQKLYTMPVVCTETCRSRFVSRILSKY